MSRTLSLRVSIVGLLVLVAAGPSLGQPRNDASSGRTLARQYCVTCHVVEAEPANAAVQADVPTFISIANKPGQSAEAIAGRIVVPHPPMPTIPLSRNEIADLAAYIMSLRKP